jgi:hypothetical protein
MKRLALSIRNYPTIKDLYNNFALLKDVEEYFHYLINNGRKLTREQAHFYENSFKFALAFRRAYEEFIAIEQSALTLKNMKLAPFNSSDN